MKRFLTLLLLLIACYSVAQTTADSNINKQLSINHYCLCKTDIITLKKENPDLQETFVEEMDLAKDCFGQDQRFIAGKGFKTQNNPGMIFQKEPSSDYISKIRLTKDFKGKLPDGKMINLKQMTLRDLFNLYPDLRNKWGSRDCSNFWNFSNDTLSFFVAIDMTKKPQFPIDKAYYLDMPVVAADFVFSCYGINSNEAHVKVVENRLEPIYFLDSVQVNKADLQKFNPDLIASLTVYKYNAKDPSLNSIYPGGAIYIQTKKFARHKYWTYFAGKSPDYLALVHKENDAGTVQYFVNNKPLVEPYDSDLAAIDDNNFLSIKVLSGKELNKTGVSTNSRGAVFITRAIK